MIAFKEEFIKRYLERFTHKLEQELNQQLPEKDFWASMIEKSNDIVRNIAKEV